jgi:hypothetical protein
MLRLNRNSEEGNPLVRMSINWDEVEINLNMLGVLELDKVRIEIALMLLQ